VRIDALVYWTIRDERDTFAPSRSTTSSARSSGPGDIDLDPDVLRGDHAPASGAAIPRRVIQPA
jgi:hypothetical protein